MRIGWKNIPWKKRIIQTVWILVGVGTMVLFGAAMVKKNEKRCAGIQVEIAGAAQHMFLDEKDILGILTASNPVTGKSIGKTNLRYLENKLERNSWVQNAEMYFDNKQFLQIRIIERQPIARVFVSGGGSFYVDSTGFRLPISDKLSARVPVFTNFPSNKPRLSNPDSALLRGIVKLASFIQADSFWMAQISQVNINGQANFEMIPLIGDQLILLGDAEMLEKKFNRLAAFYQQALLQQGINTYEKLDVRFEDQVVAVRRGSGKALVDSAQANKMIAELAVKKVPAPVQALTEPASKPAAVKPVVKKDTAVIAKALMPQKNINKKKASNQINNKTINKSLTNGQKSNTTQSVH